MGGRGGRLPWIMCATEVTRGQLPNGTAPVKIFIETTTGLVGVHRIVYPAYLDHDHREREDIRFFGKSPSPFQDFRCGPLRNAVAHLLGTTHRSLGHRHRGVGKIRDLRLTETVHQNVRLRRVDLVSSKGIANTYPFYISVNHATGVEIVQTPSNIV